MNAGCWLLAIGCWLVPAEARAFADTTVAEVDTTEARPASPRGAAGWWVGGWGAGARHSKFYTRLGVRYRDFYMVGIRLGRELPVSRVVAVDYYMDLVPLLVSTNNPVRYTGFRVCAKTAPTCDNALTMHTATVRGIGVTPIGIQLRAFPRSRVQAVFALNLGAAWYNRPVPDPDEQRLNFMGDVAAGVQMRVGRSSSIVAGLRQHHTSNAETGRVNPGIDSRVLHLGITRSLSGRSRP